MSSYFPAIILDPIIPIEAVVIAGVLLAALTVAIYSRLGSSLSLPQRIALLAFRLAGLALVLLILLRPSRPEQLPPDPTQQVTMVAVDDSQSMAQRDVEQGTRSDAAKALLSEAGFVSAEGFVTDGNVRLFKFGAEATPISTTGMLRLDGSTTRIHASVMGILSSIKPNESARGLILLTDGHDLELVNPAKTGFNARARQTPIYAVPIGRQGKVKDVAVRITSYQPYCYVKQKARISASLRLIGCELETLDVDLLRDDKIVQTQRIAAGEDPELAVHFEVSEPQVGQYEYELRVRPLKGEADLENNHAITYLNVIDQQIQVLVLEGEPYWDTSFLQRSLMRNDKMNVDIIEEFAPGKLHRTRKKEGGKLQLPQTPEEWRHYDIVVLGRSVDKMLGADGVRGLEDYVKNAGGTVIFSRGPAFGAAQTKNDLEPVIWTENITEHVRLKVAQEGQALAPFRTLNDAEANADSLPQLIAVHGISEKKPLAATLASAQGPDGAEAGPGFIHRRFGEGQVLSVGVDGLWRWAFNARVEGVNTVFDRFWDQLILWLMAGRDFLPAEQFSLRASSANIPLGEKIYFRAVLRDHPRNIRDLPLTVEQDGKELIQTTLSAPDPLVTDKLTAEFLPPKTGKYQAIARFPDGSKQIARFMVFDENVEKMEVATDINYLRRLCESSGGRLLAPEELGKFAAELKVPKSEAPAATRLRTVWDKAWCFWLIGLCFAADWFLRRRWGLC